MDRYTVDGNYRSVMLATRELDQNQLQEEAKTWVNQHLTYTHGYGIVVSPVNQVTTQGLPDFTVKDIPPQGSTDLQILRPEIYYGEVGNEYVVVKTGAKEFDYPKGDANVFTTYAGTGGVGIGSVLRQAAFSARFGTIKPAAVQLLHGGFAHHVPPHHRRARPGHRPVPAVRPGPLHGPAGRRQPDLGLGCLHHHLAASPTRSRAATGSTTSATRSR